MNEALHYMQTMNWISENATSGFKVNMETVMRIHEYLLSGITNDERYSGFRKIPLPNGRGVDPHAIPSAVNELCDFINSDMFSPLGQASVIHHAFERIVPFDSMVDRTGLLMAFLPMFRRGLFANGYVVPICWGASIDRERRRRILDSTRDDPKLESYREYRDFWASHNARNTFLAAAIANSFINAAEQIHDVWRSRYLQVQANSALDRLLDLILANPCITVGYAADSIRKSYGATNEAMQQLIRAGIVRESVSHGRERVFVCDKSAAMMTDFVARLMKLREDAKPNEAKEGNFTHLDKDSPSDQEAARCAHAPQASLTAFPSPSFFLDVHAKRACKHDACKPFESKPQGPGRSLATWQPPQSCLNGNSRTRRRRLQRNGPQSWRRRPASP